MASGSERSCPTGREPKPKSKPKAGGKKKPRILAPHSRLLLSPTATGVAASWVTLAWPHGLRPVHAHAQSRRPGACAFPPLPQRHEMRNVSTEIRSTVSTKSAWMPAARQEVMYRHVSSGRRWRRQVGLTKFCCLVSSADTKDGGWLWNDVRFFFSCWDA